MLSLKMSDGGGEQVWLTFEQATLSELVRQCVVVFVSVSAVSVTFLLSLCWLNCDSFTLSEQSQTLTKIRIDSYRTIRLSMRVLGREDGDPTPLSLSLQSRFHVRVHAALRSSGTRLGTQRTSVTDLDSGEERASEIANRCTNIIWTV